MILSSNQELRLHIPSNAVDDVSLLQGILDNSEHDFLMEKLGKPLYDKLCEYYNGIDSLTFYNNVVNGTYENDPWAVLLLNAQRMITNDALARFAYQQVISVNGSGINVVSGNDYGNADDRLLERGVSGYKKEAAIACNNLLTLLEVWAKSESTTVPDDSATVSDDSPSGIKEIITLWKQSKYYYLHSDLLIPTAHILQQYLDIYENRDKFIRLLPDIRFIQDEYIEEAFGEDFVTSLLSASEQKAEEKLLRKVRRLMVAYLEQRTQVLTVDKTRRLQAHDEAVSLKEQILAYLKKKEVANPTDKGNQLPSPNNGEGSGIGSYQNNAEGSKIFVAPLLY